MKTDSPEQFQKIIFEVRIANDAAPISISMDLPPVIPDKGEHVDLSDVAGHHFLALTDYTQKNGPLTVLRITHRYFKEGMHLVVELQAEKLIPR